MNERGITRNARYNIIHEQTIDANDKTTGDGQRGTEQKRKGILNSAYQSVQGHDTSSLPSPSSTSADDDADAGAGAGVSCGAVHGV